MYPNADNNQSTVISTKWEAEQKSSKFLIKYAQQPTTGEE